MKKLFTFLIILAFALPVFPWEGDTLRELMDVTTDIDPSDEYILEYDTTTELWVPVARLEAENLSTDTTNFDGALSVADDTIQAALDTLDDAIPTTASDLPIVDSGSIITATEVEGALQENRTAIDSNTSSSHTQGTDTSLGVQAENLDMGGFTIENINVVKRKATCCTVHNNTGASLVAGICVYPTGVVSSVVSVAKCDNTDKDKMPCLGVISVTIADGDTGCAVCLGIKGMNTSGFTGAVGDRVYVQSDGTLDTVEPTSGSVQRVGVLTVKAADGQIYVHTRGRKSTYSSVDEHPIFRMGSDAGHAKVEFRNYANAEKAYIDDDGNLTLSGASILANATASGILTQGGTGGTNNENETSDYESVANSILKSTTTGVTGVDHNYDFFVGARFGEGNRVLPAAGTDHRNRIYSNDTTQNSDYGESYHNQTDFVTDIGQGNYQIYPSAGGDVHLFSDTDVGDDVDGKSLYVHRKAAEGDDYIKLHIRSDRDAMIEATRNWSLVSFSGTVAVSSQFYMHQGGYIGNSWDVQNRSLKHYGYLTAPSAAKWVNWKLNDITDNFELTREDANILGFDIQMPLITDDITTVGTTVTHSDLATSIADNQWGSRKHDGQNLIIATDTQTGAGTGVAQACTATNATNLFTDVAHILSNTDRIMIGGTVPTGIDSTAIYYVISDTTDTFQVSLTSGGAAVTFSDDGANVTWSYASENAIVFAPRGTESLRADTAGIEVTGNIAVSGTVDGIDIATDVAANTTKTTNATHTGEVTGSGALALDPTCISGKADTTIASADYMLFWDVTDSLLKKVDAGELLAGAGDLKADGSVPLTANWDVGAYTITGLTFTSDQATGTAPFTVASTTEVANLKSATAGTADTANAGDSATAFFGAGTIEHERGGLEADVNAYTGLVKINGGSTTDCKVNWAGAAPPAAATDDITLGYIVGSFWHDTTNDKSYVCLDNTDGAAVWTETTQSGAVGANTTLSNLGSTAVNASIISDTDSTDDLGSSAKYWANAYVDEVYTPAIQFPATAVPSADANTLDDYEEGTWTPVLGGSGGTSGQSYGTQTGSYIKIGRQVTCIFHAVLSDKGTITGNLQVQGLPFTNVSLQPTLFLYTYKWTLTAGHIPSGHLSATTYLYLVEEDYTGAGHSILTGAVLVNDSQVSGTIVYGI